MVAGSADRDIHDDVERGFDAPDFMDGDDVRMVKLGRDRAFAQDAIGESGGMALGIDDFDRVGAIVSLTICLVDDAMRPASQQLAQAIAADFVSRLRFPRERVHHQRVFGVHRGGPPRRTGFGTCSQAPKTSIIYDKNCFKGFEMNNYGYLIEFDVCDVRIHMRQ